MEESEYKDIRSIFNEYLKSSDEVKKKTEDISNQNICNLLVEVKKLLEDKDHSFKDIQVYCEFITKYINERFVGMMDYFNIREERITKALTYLTENTLRKDRFITQMDQKLSLIINLLSTNDIFLNVKNNKKACSFNQSYSTSGSYYSAQDFPVNNTSKDDNEIETKLFKKEELSDISDNSKKFTENFKITSLSDDEALSQDISSLLSTSTNEEKNSVEDKVFLQEDNPPMYCFANFDKSISRKEGNFSKDFFDMDKKESENKNNYLNVPRFSGITCSRNKSKNISNLRQFIVSSKKEIEENFSIFYESRTPCILYYYKEELCKFIFLGEMICKIICSQHVKDYMLIFEKPTETYGFEGSIKFYKMSNRIFIIRLHKGGKKETFKFIFNVESEFEKFINSINSLKDYRNAYAKLSDKTTNALT